MQTMLTQVQTVVFCPQGHLNASNAEEFRQQLMESIAANPYAAHLVDLGQIDLLDSSGLMVLVSALSASQSRNQRFGLCGVSPSIRIILELTQLDRALELFEDATAFAAAIA